MEIGRGYTLVVAEKPDAALRLAMALGTTQTLREDGVEVFDVESGFDGTHYVVCAASGHLYGLSDPEKNRSVYPVFDVEWFPMDTILKSQNGRKRTKSSSFLSTGVARRIRSIAHLSLTAGRIVHACDFDLEGETIGFNILEFACKITKSTFLRAKFSTLTDEEIRFAFSRLETTNFDMARAGRMRHYIDFLWGVNLSRALSESYRDANSAYGLLTIGRVQGPTLSFVTDREVEIMTHVPVPYWYVVCKLDKDGHIFDALYREERIEVKSKAAKILEEVSEAKTAIVKSISTSVQSQPPPFPFNVGDLQKEAFRLYRYSPSVTLSIAERLYLDALISYPRTSSQKLPPSIGYSKIVRSLSTMPEFSRLTSELLLETKGQLVPRQGPLEDPAHPSIYPTGEHPKRKLKDREENIYELVVRRFLAAFARAATIQHSTATFDIAKHPFVAFGKVLKDKGWMNYYPGYLEEGSSLPELDESEQVKLLSVHSVEKYTQRSPRYTEGTLLSKMESEKIGTKATRAETIATLLDRGYLLNKKGLSASETGFSVIETMREHCPAIVSTEMTRGLEEEIDRISLGQKDELSVAKEVMMSLHNALTSLWTFQKEIGSGIQFEPKIYKQKEYRVGDCPVCKTGRLKVIRSRRSGKRFLGCTNYSTGCKASAPLPQKGSIRSTSRKCELCNWPRLAIRFGGRKAPWVLCPNPDCASKKKVAGKDDGVQLDV